MFGRILWPTAVTAFVAALGVDFAFGNPAANMTTFVAVFMISTLVGYGKRNA